MGWKGLPSLAEISFSCSAKYAMRASSRTSSGPDGSSAGISGITSSSSTRASSGEFAITTIPAASLFFMFAVSIPVKFGFEASDLNIFSDWLTRPLFSILSTTSRDAEPASSASVPSASDGFSSKAGSSAGRRFSAAAKYSSTSFDVFESETAARDETSSHPANVSFACSPKTLL